MAEQKLSEEHRAKLTAILEKLHSSGASDDDIRDTVRDYKAKYSGASDDKSASGSANTGFLDTTGTIVKNAAKAAPGGVVSGAVDAVAGLAHQAGNIAGLMNPIRLAQTIYHAPETIKSAVDYAKTIPGRLAEWPSNIVADVKKGATQPEQYGTDVGRAVGYGTGSGLAQEGIGYLPEAAAAAGAAAKPVARVTGRTITRIANSKPIVKLEQAAPYGTAVGVGTLNPAGIAGGVTAMAAPPIARKVGQVLSDFGGPTAAEATAAATKAAEAQAAETLARESRMPNTSGYDPAAPIPEAPGENIVPADPMPIEAHAPSESGYQPPQQGAQTFADAVREEAAAAQRETMSQNPYKAQEVAEGPVKGEVPPSGDVPPEAVLDSMGLKYGQDLAMNPETGVPSEYQTPDNPDWFKTDHERMIDDMERNSPQMLGGEGEANVRPGEYPPSSQTIGEIPESYGAPEQGSYDLGNVGEAPAAAPAGPEPSLDELMANRLKAAQDNMPGRGSRSKKATGKLSPNDIPRIAQIMKENPGISLQEASVLLQKMRAEASQAYRINAAMDKAGVR